MTTTGMILRRNCAEIIKKDSNRKNNEILIVNLDQDDFQLYIFIHGKFDP